MSLLATSVRLLRHGLSRFRSAMIKRSGASFFIQSRPNLSGIFAGTLINGYLTSKLPSRGRHRSRARRLRDRHRGEHRALRRRDARFTRNREIVSVEDRRPKKFQSRYVCRLSARGTRGGWTERKKTGKKSRHARTLDVRGLNEPRALFA